VARLDDWLSSRHAGQYLGQGSHEQHLLGAAWQEGCKGCVLEQSVGLGSGCSLHWDVACRRPVVLVAGIGGAGSQTKSSGLVACLLEVCVMSGWMLVMLVAACGLRIACLQQLAAGLCM
jgi:hypothetical protein